MLLSLLAVLALVAARAPLSFEEEAAADLDAEVALASQKETWKKYASA